MENVSSFTSELQQRFINIRSLRVCLREAVNTRTNTEAIAHNFTRARVSRFDTFSNFEL